MIRACPNPAARAASTQQLHAVGDDLGRVAFLPFLVLPLAGADAPLDVYRGALLEVLAGDLGELAEEGDAVPLGVLLLITALVLPFLGGRNADVGHRVAARQVARFGVGAEIADKNYLVDRGHGGLLEKTSCKYSMTDAQRALERAR